MTMKKPLLKRLKREMVGEIRLAMYRNRLEMYLDPARVV